MMTYISEAPGVKPTTIMEDTKDLSPSEFASYLNDAFDWGCSFTERECPVLGKVIDQFYEGFDEEDREHVATYSASSGWRFMVLEQMLTGWFAINAMTATDHFFKPLRETILRNLYIKDMQGLFIDGYLFEKLGVEWVETAPGEWEIKDKIEENKETDK